MSLLVKGLLFGNQVAFSAIDSREMVQKSREVHGLSPLVSAALGRTITATALMAADLKEETHKLSVSIKGDGTIGNMVSVAYGDLRVKAFASNPYADLPLNENGKLNVGQGVGKGTLTVIKDEGKPYIGTVELVSGEIGDDFAYYFLTSEQTPTLCYLGVLVDVDCSIKSAGGMILKPLPGCDENIITILESHAEYIARFSSMMASGMTMMEALDDIFLNMEMTISEEKQAQYECDCSQSRMEEVLTTLPKGELEDIIEKDKKAQIICHFCHSEYNFSEEELRELI